MIELCSPEEKTMTLEYFERRFGLQPGLFQGFKFYASAKGRVILGPSHIDANLSPDTAGLLIARIGNSVKPSTNLFQAFGEQVIKSMIILGRDQTIRLVKGLDLEVTAEEIGGTTDGYVMLKHLDFPLGCGLLQAGHVKNMIPKAKRMELKFI